MLVSCGSAYDFLFRRNCWFFYHYLYQLKVKIVNVIKYIFETCGQILRYRVCHTWSDPSERDLNRQDQSSNLRDEIKILFIQSEFVFFPDWLEKTEPIIGLYVSEYDWSDNR